MLLTSPSGRTMIIHKAAVQQKLLEGWKPAKVETPKKKVEAPKVEKVEESTEEVAPAPKKRRRRTKKES